MCVCGMCVCRLQRNILLATKIKEKMKKKTKVNTRSIEVCPIDFFFHFSPIYYFYIVCVCVEFEEI